MFQKDGQIDVLKKIYQHKLENWLFRTMCEVRFSDIVGLVFFRGADITMTLFQEKGPNAHLFNVDILIEDETNAKAFEKLLHILNESGAADFRINSGVELGKMIEKLTESPTGQPVKAPVPATEKDPQAKPVPSSVQSASTAKRNTSQEQDEVTTRILKYIQENRLIRLNVNKGLGKQLSIPCRIISLDQSNHILTVYHVDEKQVYTFSLYEIDDFIE